MGEAIGIYEEVLPIQQRVLGDEHPETLRTRGNLTIAYQRSGQGPGIVEPMIDL